MSLTGWAVPTWQLNAISHHPSYHGNITGSHAVSKLKEKGGNCYLTRWSHSQQLFVLTVLRRGTDDNGHQFNIEICKNDDYFDEPLTSVTYEIKGTQMQFYDIHRMLEFYHNNSVSHEVDGIGDCCDNGKQTPLGHHETIATLRPAYSVSIRLRVILCSAALH